MEEQPAPKKRGGKRREGTTQTPVAYKMDNDLHERLSGTKNLNRWINMAVRQRLERLEYMEKEALEAMTDE